MTKNKAPTENNSAQQYYAYMYTWNYTTTDEMIEDLLTKPKSAHNYVIVEAAQVYKMPNY